MSGVSKLKHTEADEKKKIIAKKMGGNANRPNSWSKKIEERNKENEIDADMFTKADRRKEAKGNRSKNGKEPAKSWEI